MKHTAQKFTDGLGNQLVSIRLGRNGEKGEAIIDCDDFELLMGLGMSSTWNCLPAGYVLASAGRAKGGNVGVARVLLDCGPNQSVRYRDGNKFNLRRSNLELRLMSGASTRRDRDYLTPPEMRRGATLVEGSSIHG
jgi:hypothetical protein